MTKVILGFVGPLASGKGTAAQYLKDKYQAPIFRFSTILRDVLDRLYLEQSRPKMQQLSLILRENFGQDLLASAIAKDVGNNQAEIIAVDGVRRKLDIKYLKEVPGFRLVAIEAEQKTRYQRMTMRDENTDDQQKTWAQFQTDEKQEPEQQIPKVMAEADFTIDNNGTKVELYQQIEAILEKINGSKN